MADGGGLTVAGIRLDESGAHLFREVEAGFGTALVVELVDWDDPYFGGASEVLENGTPRIRVSSALQDPAVTLIHELQHFRLRLSALPTLIAPSSRNIELTTNFLSSVAACLH